MREFDNLITINNFETLNGAENKLASLDEVLDLWAEELPENTDHGSGAVPISTVATLSTAGSCVSTWSTLSSVTCS